jgi:hypothetical protein
MVGWSAGPAAQARPASETPLAELERAFWRCDYEATQSPIDVGAAAMCSEVAETFKARRFAGDFEALLAWWRERRDGEYRKLAAAQRARTEPATPTGR